MCSTFSSAARRSFLIEPLESRTLFDVTIQIPSGKSVTFTAPDNTPGSIQFTKCAASVTFAGDNLSQNTPLVLTGTIASITAITVTHATPASSVTLRDKASDKIPLGSFQSDGPLKSVNLRQMSLNGPLNSPGIATLAIGWMQNADVEFAGYSGAKPFSIIAGNLDDSVINSPVAFKNFSTGHFLATTPGSAISPGSSALNAPAVSNLNIGGDMSADVNLTAGTRSLLKATVLGDVLGGRWNVQGNSSYFGAHSVSSQWSGTFSGSIAVLKTTQDFNGDLTVGSVTTATIGHNMTAATVRFTNDYSPTAYDFKTWTVGGSLELAYLYGPGNFGKFKGMYVRDSYVLAGVTTPSFDLNASAPFASPDARFDSVSIQCHSGEINYADSFIAAPSLGILDIGMVEPGNAGVSFGLRTARSIKQLKLTLANHPISIANAASATAITDAFTAAGLTPTDTQEFAVVIAG